MKKISIWAKHNVFAARCIIVISFVLLTAIGITTGILLNDLAVVIPSSAGTLFILLYFVGVIIYPFRTDKRKMGSYIFYKRQKTADFLLALSTFLLLVFISNHRFSNLSYFPSIQTAAASNLPGDSTVKTYKSIAAFTASMKDENGKTLKWKERKKLLKEQVKAIKKSDRTKGAKIALIVLSVLAAFVLLSLVGMAACSLACSGSEALAIIVGIGGTALVVLLLVHMIRSITGKKKKKVLKKEEELKTG